MPGKTVLLTDPISPAGEAVLARALRIVRAPDSAPETTRTLAREADGIIIRSKLPDDIFEAAPAVRAVCIHGTGTDFVPLESATARGVMVANVPGANAQSVAEFCAMGMLMLARNIVAITHALRSGPWDEARKGGIGSMELEGRTVGIVGVGEIGRRLARICRQGFGMRVLGNQRRLDRLPPDAQPAALEPLLAESDFVVIACPLTPQTRHLINERTLAAMKKSAWLINVGRGAVVDESALVAALKEGRLAGAMLDVYEQYRLPPGHELRKLDNVILTPHLAGLTVAARDRLGVAAAQLPQPASLGDRMRAHVILPPENAIPDSRGSNLFRLDPSFGEFLGIYLSDDLRAFLAPHFERLGALAGDELDALAAAADLNPPRLHHRTRAGEERQWIEKHPAYQRLEEAAFSEYGLAAMSHRGGVLGWSAPLPPAAKYALSYLFVQAEFGVCCPLSMTDSLARTLSRFGDPQLVARYLPGLTSQDMDSLAQGAMFITEQGAGSDVGATATRAAQEPAGGIGEASAWRLYGEKWFCSNADASLALVLARPDGAPAGTKGLSLFLLPRNLADGTSNSYRIIRLKDKLGTRGMASGEVRLEGALAYLVGDPGKGFVQMTDMINMSRLSNGMRAAGLMRRALTEALFVARRRTAFRKRLIEMPLMRRQLLKLMLPAEAARSVLFFTAAQLQAADTGDDAARRRVRLLTPLLKFRACRDARKAAGDAMEVRGGCGYIEEWPDARILRDAHLGSIWEGTSNIVALDALRAIRKEAALEVLLPSLAGTPVFRLLQKAAAFAAGADESHARQAASGLYYAVAASVLWQEGTRLADSGDARRLLLSALVRRHKLETPDPLGAVECPFDEALLEENPVSRAEARRFLEESN